MKPQDTLLDQILAVTGVAADYDQDYDRVEFHFGPEMSRREFVQILGAGLIIAVAADAIQAQNPQQGGRRVGGFMGRGAANLAARLHIGTDGVITVMTGKVECGQGARAEVSQAAAEELRVPISQVRLIMADTGLVPDDGGTFGSFTTPATIPAIRQACASARDLLAALASRTWSIESKAVVIREGTASDPSSGRSLSYVDLASEKMSARAFATAIPNNVSLTPVNEWKVLGTPVPRPNGRDIVIGSHQYPSDVTRPGMLYGKILRRPSYGATLSAVDLDPAKNMKDVVAVRDKDFVGVAAPSSSLAEDALDAISAPARWGTSPHPSSSELFGYLRQHARGGVPKNPFADELAKAAKTLRQSYNVAYVQHCPMEPRAAVAEWENGKLTVWTGTQNPFAVRSELMRAFNLSEDRVRVIIPDFGGGFGGKHPGECAVEAARLAKEAGKPVGLRWTREEEFTWAQFRPAGVIDAEASLDSNGMLTSWHFVNINSGGQEVQTPYRAGKAQGRFVESDPPLRHGSYRALAATANTFGRECFMDELATLAGQDPLAFRLAHLENPRLRAVLEEAARRFDWASRWKKSPANHGVGLACGTDKGSFVAACVEISVNPEQGHIKVTHVCQAFECGKILNPSNLLSQVKGAITMGLGPALREEMQFDKGKMLNAAFSAYKVPRFEDVPELEIHLLDRPDLPSAGAGETPIIAIAPAIANAVYAAAGTRMRDMPIRLPRAKANA